uniref:Uncharacterized protein n=1 Tax=Panagrolaimus sp. JU765 TaxID=591449 RepID=A0AC34PVZ5_9BILA
MNNIFIFSCILLIILPTTIESLKSVRGTELTDFTVEQLRQLCPNEHKFCAEKIVEGKCFGNSKKAQELKRKCPCSCNNVHHKRIQNCCKTIGKEEMEFCLPLCAYNNTLSELGGGLGIKCVSQLTTWAYCAADANDATTCCKEKGVPNECLSFCKGDVPTCDLQSIFNYKPCLKNMGHITECHKQMLGIKPNFDPEWEAPCEWE